MKLTMTNVALAHDYLTQRGGAERVALSLLRAFPGAALHTSLYEPGATFPEFGRHDVIASALNRVGVLRRNHRLALPLLAPAFSSLHIDAEVVVCSSSGWAHGIRTSGRKLVYCHNPARWLYQTDQYLAGSSAAVRRAFGMLAPCLRSWDRWAAHSADRYVANSTIVRNRIRRTYGIDASVVHPPHTIDAHGPQEVVADVADDGFLLCVSRLLPYKNIDAVIVAVARLRERRLVVVGSGPDRDRLRSIAPSNVIFLDRVSDAELRWLYGRCVALVTAAHEDFGITALEAAVFGKPVAALRGGGFLDTVREGVTGVFFDRPEPEGVAAAILRLESTEWDRAAITAHAEAFSEARFVERMRQLVGDLVKDNWDETSPDGRQFVDGC